MTVDLITLRVLAGINPTDTSYDTVLTVYFNVAVEKVLARLYPFVEDTSSVTIPQKYQFLTHEIAAYFFNKQGAEGETSHSENGINRAYASADIPPHLLSQLTPYAGVIGFASNSSQEG